MYTAKDYANRADYWRSHKLGRPFQQRIIRGTQDEAARLAGYTAPVYPNAFNPERFYRTTLHKYTRYVGPGALTAEETARILEGQAENWARIADTLRRNHGTAWRIRNAQDLAAGYAKAATTIADPDYWIEH